MSKTIIQYVILVFGICPYVQAQSQTYDPLDSLEQLVFKTDSEFQKANLFLEIARAASGSDSLKAYENAKKGLAFYEQQQDSLGMAKGYATMGFVVFDYGDMVASERYYQKAVSLFEKQMQTDSLAPLRELWADAALNLASSIGNQGRNDEEIAHLIKLAPIVKRHQNYKVLALINSNLGVTFLNNKDLNKAYSYFNGNDLFYERTKAYSQFATDRLIFSSCLLQMDSLIKAKSVLENAHELLKKIPNSPRWYLYHQQLGDYYAKSANYGLALDSYAKSMHIVTERKYYGALPQLYLQYVALYKLMGNKQKEKESMLKFYEVSKANNPPDELFALQELAKYEERDGNHKKAMDYATRYFSLADSVRLTEIETEVARMEQLYQKEKKDREILELTNQSNKANLNLEVKKSQTYLLYFLLGALGLVSISGYLTYRNRQRRTVLKQQVQERELQQLKVTQERTLFGAMIEGVEQERKRLAADLHDGLGGRLSAVSLKLSRLSEDITVKKVVPEIEGILDNLDDSLEELRGIARNLMPDTLLKYGLKAALEDYCSTLKNRETNIVLQFYGEGNIKDHNKRLTVYRIIQELINNAVKHASAKEILVQFIQDNDKIDITVEDDGVGFLATEHKKGTSLGITTLKNRVQYLNGQMDIRSEIQEGTSVNIQIEGL